MDVSDHQFNDREDKRPEAAAREIGATTPNHGETHLI